MEFFEAYYNSLFEENLSKLIDALSPYGPWVNTRVFVVGVLQTDGVETLAQGKFAISKYLANVFETGKLKEETTISKVEIVQQDGGRTEYRNAH